MKTIKFTVISCLIAFIAINVSVPRYATAGGLIDMGYGSRGESMLGGKRSIPLRKSQSSLFQSALIMTAAKVELGKKLFFEPRLSKSGWINL